MSTLRITGGKLRGRRIPVPKNDVRPTSERARQAFFNIVAGRIDGARFLDLFAGSGIFSFEALSRGAASSVAVDSSARNLSAIDSVARDLEVTLRLVRGEIPGVLARLSGTFDIVYADPPYAFGAYDDLLRAIGSRIDLAAGALVAIEHRRRVEPFTIEPDSLGFLRRAEYGEVWISMWQSAAGSPQSAAEGEESPQRH